MVNQFITLLTDFGLQDGYVGALHGRLAKALPACRCIDLSHHIPPQDVLSGAISLLLASSTWPQDTMHIAVVDPGVGSSRGGLLVKAWQQWFLGPDSGILHFPLSDPNAIVYSLPTAWQEKTNTTTFDALSWFVPAAIQVIKNPAGLNELSQVNEFTLLNLPLATFEPYRWQGHVIHIDRYGNLVTDLPIPPQHVFDKTRVFLGKEAIGPIRLAYQDVDIKQPLASVGALTTIEISLRNDSAFSHFSVTRGSSVELLFSQPIAMPEKPWWVTAQQALTRTGF